MELFDSPTFEPSTRRSPRRPPPSAVRTPPNPTSGFDLLNFGSQDGPIKKMLDSKWLIPICTVVAVVIFFIGVWLYSNYFSGTPQKLSVDPPSKEGSSNSDSNRVKSLSKTRQRRTRTPESAKRRSYHISDYDRTTPMSTA